METSEDVVHEKLISPTEQVVRSKSLSFSLFLTVLITHGLFLYGQIDTMWLLSFEAHFEGTVQATSWESKLFFETVGINLPLEVNTTEIQKLEEFTYGK